MKIVARTAAGRRYRLEYPYFFEDDSEDVSLANEFSEKLISLIREESMKTSGMYFRLTFSETGNGESSRIEYRLTVYKMREAVSTKALSVLWKNGLIKEYKEI